MKDGSFGEKIAIDISEKLGFTRERKKANAKMGAGILRLCGMMF